MYCPPLLKSFYCMHHLRCFIILVPIRISLETNSRSQTYFAKEIRVHVFDWFDFLIEKYLSSSRKPSAHISCVLWIASSGTVYHFLTTADAYQSKVQKEFLTPPPAPPFSFLYSVIWHMAVNSLCRACTVTEPTLSLLSLWLPQCSFVHTPFTLS